MAANDNPERGEPSLEGLQQEVEALKGRVAQLEATLRHEHDDLVRLKEETMADHRKLEGLSDIGSGGSSGAPVTPVGL